MQNDTINTYIGIDLGTSNMKLLLVSSDGEILSEASQTYNVSYPKSGWSEQSPEDWYKAAMRGIKSLLDGQDRSRVKGISFGGQMHGLVALDDRGEVIRPCILWNDGRAQEETDYLNRIVGRDNLTKYTGNIAFAGFTAPKLLWMKKNEPENFARINKIMLPKDYIAYKLTGEYSTDVSDASGTLLFDVKERTWSAEMCGICGIADSMLPKLYESCEKTGELKDDAADELGLAHGVSVAAGAGDNAAAAVGTGVVGRGGCNISLGTSGTLFVSSDVYAGDKTNALHGFCHADGGYHLMGCILSAASCNAWWSDSILGSADYEEEQRGIKENLGCNDVYFLPYLMGERSPHNDVNARGAFIGMRADTTRKHMTQAVLEGVAFALLDCLRAARADGADISRTTLCGGGAKSAVWRQIIADVTGLPVDIPLTEQGPAYGAAMLAMVACGEYPDVISAARAIVRVKETIYPDAAAAARYKERYKTFTMLYPALKSVFR